MPTLTHLARAPVRVDPAGGGTDAPPFCTDYGGAVVNFGIALYVHARLVVRPEEPTVTITSLDLDATVEAPNVQQLEIDGRLDLLKGIARRMAPPWGFHLTVESDVLPGSGLGSSGAAGVACVGVFDQALGTKRSQVDTAELANAVEREDLGMPGGSQDSYGAALGGMNMIVYHANGGTTARSLAVPDATRHELNRRGVLVYTGEVHLSGNIHRDIKESYAQPDSPTVDAMKNLARVAASAAEALEAGAPDKFGEFLSENWLHHKRLHASCTSTLLDRYYDATREYVVGGKTCGAGGGGCILFLARDSRRHELRDACAELGGVLYPFQIAPEGLVRWST